MSPPRKRCVVAWAHGQKQLLIEVEVPEAATVAEVIEAARRACAEQSVPWQEAPVGIFGRLCDRTSVPRDGERVELYRPLRIDPKAARRSRARPRGGG